MKCGLIGPSSVQRSLPFDAQRTVNLYPVLDQQGKEVAALYGTPGKTLLASAGVGPGRGGFFAANGRAFFVSGSGFYEVNSSGVTTLYGNLDTSDSIVTCDENGTQLAVCDGTSLYIFTYATNAFAKVVSPNLPSAASVTFIDGYFVVNRSPNSGIFQISALYDGFTWGALDFATAESSPDSLLRVLNVGGQLWLVGSKTTEIWSNTGAAGFTFERIAGAKMSTGTSSAYTALQLDNSLFWVGQDEQGFGIVYRAQGFSPQRISTEPIELLLRAAPAVSTLRTFSYQEDGHTFFCITGGGMQTSLYYDLATQLWHERAYLNESGIFEQDLAAFTMYAFNRIICIDRRNGSIYTQAMDIYSDNGEEIARERTFTHLSEENQRAVFKNLTIGFETGVGLIDGNGSDPKCTLYLSRDGGKTWTGGITQTIGKIGQYLNRVIFWRLGQARIMTFRVRITDPVAVRICGAYFNNEG